MTVITDDRIRDEEDYIFLYSRLRKLKIESLPANLLTKFRTETEAAMVALRLYAFSQAGFVIWERDLSELQKKHKWLTWISILAIACAGVLDQLGIIDPISVTSVLAAVGIFLFMQLTLLQEIQFARLQFLNYAKECRNNLLACEQIFAREGRINIGHDLFVLARLFLWSGNDEGVSDEFSGLDRNKLFLDEQFLNLTMSTADEWDDGFWDIAQMVRLKVEVWVADTLGDHETTFKPMDAPEHLYVEGLNILGWDFKSLDRARLRAVLDQQAAC